MCIHIFVYSQDPLPWVMTSRRYQWVHLVQVKKKIKTKNFIHFNKKWVNLLKINSKKKKKKFLINPLRIKLILNLYRFLFIDLVWKHVLTRKTARIMKPMLPAYDATVLIQFSIVPNIDVFTRLRMLSKSFLTSLWKSSLTWNAPCSPSYAIAIFDAFFTIFMLVIIFSSCWKLKVVTFACCRLIVICLYLLSSVTIVLFSFIITSRWELGRWTLLKSIFGGP